MDQAGMWCCADTTARRAVRQPRHPPPGARGEEAGDQVTRVPAPTIAELRAKLRAVWEVFDELSGRVAALRRALAGAKALAPSGSPHIKPPGAGPGGEGDGIRERTPCESCPLP